MGLMCRLTGHTARDKGVWNDGYFFSKCGRCDCDLLRTDGDWRAVPRGLRVTWKRGHQRHAIRSNFRRNLPLAPRKPRGRLLGALTERLILLPGPKNRDPEGNGDYAAPVLLALFTLIGLGVPRFGRR